MRRNFALSYSLSRRNVLQVGVVEGEDYTFKVTGKPAVQQPGEDPPAEGELSLELHMQYDNSDDEVIGGRLTYGFHQSSHETG